MQSKRFILGTISLPTSTLYLIFDKYTSVTIDAIPLEESLGIWQSRSGKARCAGGTLLWLGVGAPHMVPLLLNATPRKGGNLTIHLLFWGHARQRSGFLLCT